ncbi:MAG: ATP-grasp domain-containing protein [Acidobacteria bacterium]|nr:ATP-grasp domain-containing protein [Acidobacteriota bacterium]
MPRILLVTTTTGYQTRAFAAAAERLAVDLAIASDRCHVLDDPWRDAAIPVRFHEEREAVRAIREAAADRPFDGVVAAGDRPAVIASLAAEALDLPGHPPLAARAAANKLRTRERLRAAGLPCPRFRVIPRDADAARDAVAVGPADAVGPGDAVRPAGAVGPAGAVRPADRVGLPCVVKPLAMSASRGVMRADTPDAAGRAAARLCRLLEAPEVRALRDPANDVILIEEYIDGREVAVEGVVTAGRFRTLAIFDKPDPLEGPHFEESIYVTPAALDRPDEQRVVEQVTSAAAALGLTHGPVHAECRLNARGVFVIDIAARPIGGLCARALRFHDGRGPAARPLEELLLLHALGRDVGGWRRVPGASGVMMIPVPRQGRYEGVAGVGAARSVRGVEDVVITAAVGQPIAPPPEGGSYLGFLFARARRPAAAVAALRRAHDCLRFDIRPTIAIRPRSAASEGDAPAESVIGR